MATINITKVSAVISVTQTAGSPKSYFGSTGKYAVNGDGISYSIQIGSDNYQVSLVDLKINGQSPSSIENGLILLGAIFGT